MAVEDSPSSRLARLGAELLGGTLAAAQTVHGGDLSQIQRISLASGRQAIVKSGPAPQIEAAMLEALAASGAPAPKVLAASERALVLELLPAGGGLADAWDSLGSALALLHGTLGERYGWHANYAFGPVAIENAWTDDWTGFWAERRLIVHCSHIGAPLARRLEALARALSQRLPGSPAPSLLHGDLWGGNVLVAGARVTGLIDPACYYGHGEVDIAMLRLFNAPGASFYANYGPLEPGYEERLAIYSLWPALVHLRLFGDVYAPMVDRFLKAAGV